MPVRATPRVDRASCVRLEQTSPVLFLSDIHLGDGSTTDLFGDQDERLIGFIEEQRSTVETIVFLGDIVDMPQAWRTQRVSRAHPAVMAYLRELVRKQRVVFVRGNHDWSVDYEHLFDGSTCTEAVLIGERTLAWHGHQMDLHMNPGVEDAMLKTYIHALAERAVGCRLVPPLERYDSLPNRAALTLAVGWARWLMARARIHRSFGEDACAADLTLPRPDRSCRRAARRCRCRRPLRWETRHRQPCVSRRSPPSHPAGRPVDRGFKPRRSADDLVGQPCAGLNL